MVFQAAFWSCRRVRAGSSPSSCLHVTTAGRASPALHIHSSSCQAAKHSKYHLICQEPLCYTSARQVCSWAGCSRLQLLEMGLFPTQVGAEVVSKLLHCSSELPQLLPLSQPGAWLSWEGWEGQLHGEHGSCSARFSCHSDISQAQALLGD